MCRKTKPGEVYKIIQGIFIAFIKVEGELQNIYFIVYNFHGIVNTIFIVWIWGNSTYF